MALEHAVELIVEQMLEEAKDLEGDNDAGKAYTRSTLRGYARQLKTALKACEGTQAHNGLPAGPNGVNQAALAQMGHPGGYPMAMGQGMPMGQMGAFMLSPQIQRAVEVDKYRAEFANKHAKLEEDVDGDLVELVDGPDYDPSVPTHVSVPAGGEIGQKIMMPDGVYRLRNRGGKRVLVYDEVETQEAKKALADKGGEKKSGIILGGG